MIDNQILHDITEHIKRLTLVVVHKGDDFIGNPQVIVVGADTYYEHFKDKPNCVGIPLKLSLDLPVN